MIFPLVFLFSLAFCHPSSAPKDLIPPKFISDLIKYFLKGYEQFKRENLVSASKVSVQTKKPTEAEQHYKWVKNNVKVSSGPELLRKIEELYVR